MQLLTVAQVAEQTGLAEWTIRRAIRDGELTASKLRGRLRVDALDLEAWVQDSRVVPSPASSPELPRAMRPAPGAPVGGSFRSRMRKETA